MSIFPLIEFDSDLKVKANNELPMIREWAFDINSGRFLKRNGQMYIVEGLDALRIQLWKEFNSPRFELYGYSGIYGHDLQQLIGSGYSHQAITSEVIRMCMEVCLSNPYVTGAREFIVTRGVDNLSVHFTVDTVYGVTNLELLEVGVE
jgi:hypothetical protein